LAEEVRARLSAAPVEEFVIKEDYEDAPPETRIVGRVLFLDLHTPASRIEDAAVWNAVLAPDGDTIIFWQTYAGGHTLAWPCPRITSYAEATDEGPHPLAWLMAARLLGLPFPGEEGAGGQSPHSSPRPIGDWQAPADIQRNR
jgi:hypothetical protein